MKIMQSLPLPAHTEEIPNVYTDKIKPMEKTKALRLSSKPINETCRSKKKSVRFGALISLIQNLKGNVLCVRFPRLESRRWFRPPGVR
jgi:hypothetical protein